MLISDALGSSTDVTVTEAIFKTFDVAVSLN